VTSAGSVVCISVALKRAALRAVGCSHNYLEKPGTVGIPNRILQDSGTELLKAHRTGTVLGKPGQTGPLCIYCKI
jgi:hypothetical protein